MALVGKACCRHAMQASGASAASTQPHCTTRLTVAPRAASTAPDRTCSELMLEYGVMKMVATIVVQIIQGEGGRPANGMQHGGRAGRSAGRQCGGC